MSARIGLDLSRRWILVLDDTSPMGSSGSKPARLIVFLDPLEVHPADDQLKIAISQIGESRHVHGLFEHLRDADSTHESTLEDGDPAQDPGPQGDSTEEGEGSSFRDLYSTSRRTSLAGGTRTNDTGADAEKRRGRRSARRIGERDAASGIDAQNHLDLYDDPYR
jgi:hypothetical protein